MIILKVIGGLGNQMFEVAYARALSLELKEDIYLDISVYERYKIRNFSLSNLNISNSVEIIEGHELPKLTKISLKSSQKMYHVYQKVVRVLSRSDRIGRLPFLLGSKFGLYFNFDRYYYEIPLSTKEIKCIYGYFQSEKYFQKYKDIIVEEMKVKTSATDQEQKILDEIGSCNAVAVSMRLGDDYINSAGLNVCTTDFYYKAIEYIKNKHPDAVFYIFSDLIDRAKNQFNFDFPVRYIEGFNDYQSLRLMYSCKHFAISNSSFSWWGAYLSTNPNKIVVAPNKWYNNSKDKPDIFLDEMVLIDV